MVPLENRIQSTHRYTGLVGGGGGTGLVGGRYRPYQQYGGGYNTGLVPGDKALEGLGDTGLVGWGIQAWYKWDTGLVLWGIQAQNCWGYRPSIRACRIQAQFGGGYIPSIRVWRIQTKYQGVQDTGLVGRGEIPVYAFGYNTPKGQQ